MTTAKPRPRRENSAGI
ncbi:uncharacterized, partial [Tachysurus ichikawai]